MLAGIVLFAACSEDEPLSVDGANEAPTVLIQSPAYNGADPTEVLARPTLVIKIADPDDPAGDLSFRWTFVSTIPFSEDWVATEDSVTSNPDSLAWSDWNPYAPSDTGLAVTVTDSLDFGFYVLAVQARDPDRARSDLGNDSMRRIVAGNGLNDPPVVTIHSPVSNAPDPVDISSQPTLRIEVTDADDIVADLSFRWAFVRTSSHAQDWTATEDDIRTNPEEVGWSNWNAWAPEDDGTMSVNVPAPLAFGPYVLTVQAKDRNARRSDIGAGSLRRVRVCAAVNDTPAVNILIPVRNPTNPATVPPIAVFTFAASDLDNAAEDLSVRWAMVDTREFDDSWVTTIDYLRKDPTVLALYGKTPEDAEAEWSAWVPYESGAGSMAITMGPMNFGGYIFAVQTRDPCDGFMEVLDEVFNVRRIRVSNSPTAPFLSVRNPHVGPVQTTVCNPPIVIADILSSIPMRFEISADASAYGGVVTGYRYGWDINDLDDGSQWDIDFTPFVGSVARTPPRTYFFGTHTFHVEVRDNYGSCSRVEIKLNYIPYAPTRDLLLVDDFAADQSANAGWDHPTGNGALPTDEEHDQFWLDMLDNVSGFDPSFDVIEVTGGTPIPLTVLANYKNIIWSVFTDVGQSGGLPLLYEYLEYQQKDPPPGTSMPVVREPNPLALFMEAGGHILISGRHPLTTTINRLFVPAPRFPLMFLWDQEGDQDSPPDIDFPLGDESFAYLHLSLETTDFAIPSTSILRNNNFICSVASLRPITATTLIDDGMREAIPLDPWFPRLELRVETAGGLKAYSPTMRSYEAEVYNPQYFFDICDNFLYRPRDNFEPIYGLHCPNTSSATYNAPVAFWTSAFAGVAGGPSVVPARSAVFGFPLVYFDPAQVKPALEYILFNEWQLPRSP
jgi:hypothetical protein